MTVLDASSMGLLVRATAGCCRGAALRRRQRRIQYAKSSSDGMCTFYQPLCNMKHEGYSFHSCWHPTEHSGLHGRTSMSHQQTVAQISPNSSIAAPENRRCWNCERVTGLARGVCESVSFASQRDLVVEIDSLLRPAAMSVVTEFIIVMLEGGTKVTSALPKPANGPPLPRRHTEVSDGFRLQICGWQFLKHAAC